MRAFRSLTGVCFAAIAGAQSTIPAAPPPHEIVRLAVAGPAAWRARLGPTNLGTMLASEAADRMQRTYLERFDAAWRKVCGDAPGLAPGRPRVLDYAGTMHLVSWLEQAEDAVHVARWSAALIAEPDGHTDLEALAKECGGWLDRASGLASKSWREMHAEPPRCHEGRLLLVFGTDEDRAAAAARAERFRGEPLAAHDVVRLQIEPRGLLGQLRDRPQERGVVATLLGAATRRITFTIGCAGPQVALALDLAWGDGDRGAFAGLLPERTGVPDLASLAPQGTVCCAAWQFDGAAAWRAWTHTAASLWDQDPDAMRTLLERRVGCDPAQTIVPHLRGEAALLWWRESRPGAALESGVDACLVVAVRDEPALLAALAAAGQQVATADDGIARVRSRNGHELAIGRGLACVTWSATGQAHGDEVFARAAARATRAGAPLERGTGVSGQVRIDVTPGAVGAFAAQLQELLFLCGFWRAMHLLPAVDEVVVEAERWQELLRQHQLDAVTGEVRNRAGGCQLRLLW